MTQAQQKTFYAGQAIAANTYNNIMINAFWMIKLDTNPENFKESTFDDFIMLANDKTQSKTELANLINDFMTETYHDKQGKYIREDLKEVKSSYTFEWLANINNNAIKTVQSFNKDNLVIIA